MDAHSPDLQVQRSPVNSRHLQPTSLSALADDASTLAAAQQQLAPGLDPNDAHSFQPFQSAIESFGQEKQHHGQQQQQQHADHAVNTPTFMRPPRPGELMNTLLITPQQQQPQQQLGHVSPRRQERLSDDFRELSNAGNDHVGIPHAGHQPASSQGSTRTNSNASEIRDGGFEMLQSTVPYLQQQQGSAFVLPIDSGTKSEGHTKGMRLVPDPPDLDAWREKLFNVDETITLSEQQYQTYFPHVDNVYSHRSTQRYKRKPFVSHYWDCRLKGRPPGTPKSDDPNKKKRKRTARQRDLCDVKIKITEYFPGFGVVPGSPPEYIAGNQADSFPPSSELLPGVNTLFNHPSGDEHDGSGRRASFGVLTPNPTLPVGHPGATGERYYTIQRVNGNGANGKNDGVGGGHRHTLEESDRVKKNSVQRHLLKEIKDSKKPVPIKAMPVQDPAQQKTYHTKATGLAAATAINRSKETDLKLYGSCFCPFVQRVWIALELKGIPYQYIEVDPYQKPQSLLEVNPRGLVPALRHGNWGCYESTVLLEYLEDLNIGAPLLPPGDAQLRAHCRLWTDHINRNIVPTFYRVLQEQEQEKQISNAHELRDSLNSLVTAAHVHGPFFLGPDISFVDIQIAPWILRLSRVLKPYRGWPDTEGDSRWGAWVNAIETNEHVRATTSTDELYLDSYERYAQNRPNTSQLANAINSGRGLP